MIPQRESTPEQREEMARRAVSNGVDTMDDVYASFIRWMEYDRAYVTHYYEQSDEDRKILDKINEILTKLRVDAFEYDLPALLVIFGEFFRNYDDKDDE